MCEALTHAAFEDTDQVVFDVTATDVDAPPATGAQVAAARLNVGAATAADVGWVTVTDAVEAGLPTVLVKVTTPVRAAAVLLAVTASLTGVLVSELEIRPKPVCGVTVTQDGAEATFHAVLEGTMTLIDCWEAVGFQDDSVAAEELATFTTGVLAVGRYPVATSACSTSAATLAHDNLIYPSAPHPVPQEF